MQPDLSLIPVVVSTPGVSVEERAVRQRMQVLIPVLGVCSALALYLLAR